MLEFIDSLDIETVIRGFGLLVGGLFATVLLAAIVERSFATRGMHSIGKPLATLLRWSLGALVIFTVLIQIGFDFGVIVGAAGILTVALGFASQTAASNIISGLFLLWEKPFAVGDWIEADGIEGEVFAIDLLSMRIRRFDNQLVRIPNETILKTNIRNLSSFPIRRVEIPIGISYSDDARTVQELLLGIAKAHPHCLDEPEPIVRFEEFGDSAQLLCLFVWVDRTNLLTLPTELRIQIKEVFDGHGVTIPFPHRTVETIGNGSS